MIERLQRVLDEVEHLPPDVQEQLAEQIEPLVRAAMKPAGAPAHIESLGQRLAALRKQIVESGEPLFSWDGVAAEVAERRGERESDVDQ